MRENCSAERIFLLGGGVNSIKFKDYKIIGYKILWFGKIFTICYSLFDHGLTGFTRIVFKQKQRKPFSVVYELHSSFFNPFISESK